MTVGRLYLDHNATAPLRPAARDAMVSALSLVGNPSSVHREGRGARALVEAARSTVAALVGADAPRVVFTSGGTEAANLALTPYVATGAWSGIDWLFVAATEHACVLQGHRFPPERVRILPVGPDGVLDLDALDAELGRVAGRRVTLALQAANNETGVRQPVSAAAALVHAHGGIVVCDAVQAAGRVPVAIGDLGADVLILSAHKFGGPKGAGALVFRSPDLHIADRLVRGGGQERGLRAGTENVAAIAGFAAACASIDVSDRSPPSPLRDGLEAQIAAIAPDAILFGAAAPRLPNTVCFAVPGVSAETLLMGFDLEGVAVWSGAACSSGKVGRSHVLAAMGVPPDLAAGAIRLSLGWSSTERDVEGFGRAFGVVLSRLRRMRRVAA